MHDTHTPAPRGASYNSSGPAMVIHVLTVNNPTVCSEAARWSSGQRGPAVGANDLIGVDLSPSIHVGIGDEISKSLDQHLLRLSKSRRRHALFGYLGRPPQQVTAKGTTLDWASMTSS